MDKFNKVDTSTYCSKCESVVDFEKTYALKLIYNPQAFGNPFEYKYICDDCVKDVGIRALELTSWSVIENKKGVKK